MTPRELMNLAALRAGLLWVLDANRTQFGLNAAALTLHSRMRDIVLTEEQAVEFCEYWTDKGYAAEVVKDANRAVRSWKITPAGIEYLDQHNL